jgi:hypothetical protein
MGNWKFLIFFNLNFFNYKGNLCFLQQNKHTNVPSKGQHSVPSPSQSGHCAHWRCMGGLPKLSLIIM